MSRQRKIFILCFTGGSGITHYSISLARELAASADVTLVTAGSYRAQGYPPENFHVVPLFGRSRRYPLDVVKVLRLIVAQRPDTVLLQSVLKVAGVEAMLVRMIRMLGIDTAMTIHDVLPHYPKPWSRWTHAFLYRSFDRLIVHSERSGSDVSALGVKCPVLVVPHGVYDIFITRPPQREIARRRLTPFADEHFVLLFFGKIDVRKGIRAFLDLRHALAAEGCRFVVAGRKGLPPEQAELVRRLDAARGSEDCVVHDHDIPFAEVQDYFALADVVVLPYQEGTTSGVLKLALAFGKPVIATDVGDIGETLKDGVGVLLPVGCTAGQLADAVRDVRANYSRYAVACSRERERYGWKRIGEEYARFLSGVQSPVAVSTTVGEA